MEIPKSTQFASLQLHKMPPGEHWTLDKQRVIMWGETWIRFRVSNINARYNANLKCHKNKDGSLTIWHNPEPRKQDKSAQFDKLIWLRGQLDEYRRLKAYDPNPNAFLNEMLAIQEQIDNVLVELRYDDGEPRKKQGNAIYQPLSVVLAFYAITEEIWNSLPLKLQMRKKIQAEVAIKERRRAEESK